MTRRTSLPTETVPPAGLDGLVIGLYISGVPAFSQKQTDSPLQVDSSGQAMSCRCVVGGGVGLRGEAEGAAALLPATSK